MYSGTFTVEKSTRQCSLVVKIYNTVVKNTFARCSHFFSLWFQIMSVLFENHLDV